MFTGLIERRGLLKEKKISTNGMTTFVIDVGSDFSARLGDSIAVDGCCLTIAELHGTVFHFDLSKETLSLTTLGMTPIGGEVNLERALQVGARLGGHFVTGHIDGVAKVESWELQKDGSARLKVGVPLCEKGLVVHKGSLCLAGVSLTVNAVNDSGSQVLADFMLIPHTLKETNLHKITLGQPLNYETDMLGKYVRAARTAYTC